MHYKNGRDKINRGNARYYLCVKDGRKFPSIPSTWKPNIIFLGVTYGKFMLFTFLNDINNIAGDKIEVPYMQYWYKYIRTPYMLFGSSWQPNPSGR